MQNTRAYFSDKWINYFFWIIAVMSFCIIAIRSYTVPVHHDEAATFYFYIETGDYLPFMAHIDANNHVLNSFSSFVCFKLFGDSPFSLRLPNTLSFLILIIGAWRIFKTLHALPSKCILIGGLLLTFHFHTFFSTARGYGLSMALLIFSISYFISYLKSFSLSEFILCFFSFQLAISSNLVLIMVILPFIGILMFSQFINNQFSWKVLLIHVLNLGLIYYWVKFSFFLQDNNALYYGDGLSYYKTTYLSLVKLLSGYSEKWMAVSGSIILVLAMLWAIYKTLKLKFDFKQIVSDNFILLSVILASLILGFYALKKLMGVNYPEDRTGLFFYVLYVLSIVYALEDFFRTKAAKFFSFMVLGLFITHYVLALNFRKHSLVNYETIPQSFYNYLVNEQHQRKERITIAGHRVRELFYAFDNYQNGGELNLMDDSDFLHMNADYAIALKNEKGYYQNFYEEVMEEPDWNFVLLKRRFPITRKQTLDLKLDLKIEGQDEFYDIYKVIKDTLIQNHLPIMVEFDFKIVNSDVPNRSWLVMQLDTNTQGGHYYYKRIPLNWLRYKWDEQKLYTYSLSSGSIHKNLQNMSFYVYNFQKQNISIHVLGLRLYELHGKGVDVVSKVIN